MPEEHERFEKFEDLMDEINDLQNITDGNSLDTYFKSVNTGQNNRITSTENRLATVEYDLN